MSLINQVLRDLDQRSDPEAARVGSLHAVAAAPGRLSWRGSWHLPRRLPMAALAGLALGALLLGHASSIGSRATAASLQTPMPTNTPTPTQVPGPVVSRGASTSAADHASVTPPGPAAGRAETARLALAHPSTLASASAPGAAGRADASRPAAAPRSASAKRAPSARALALAADPAHELIDTPNITKTSAQPKALERAEAAYHVGVSAHESGDYAAAERAYAAALKDHAAKLPARVGLAGVLIALSRLDEAEAVLQAGLAADPQQALLAQPLARLLADRGRLTTALDVMQSALAGGSGLADYRACFGALLQRAGRHPEAAAHFDVALRLAPSNGVWWMGLAISLAAEGRGEAARIAYARARNSGSLSPELAHFVEQRLQRPM